MNCRRQGAQGANRGNVENTSLALPDHFFVDRFSDSEQAVDICMNHFVPGAVRGGGKVITAVDCRVINQDINAAPFLNKFACQMLHAKAIGYRYFERERAPAVGLDLAAHFFGQVVPGPIVESYVGAFARKHFTDCSADTTRSARNEGPLILKQKTHALLFS